MSAKPLVSLCITCCNQAKYIRESLQSAFDQTYSPLEIVISDDCSTDGTDEIIRRMTAEYTGPHSIVFNRNETNLFVCKNYEKAFMLAHGELLVTGAGDDVSMPNRVERIVEAWEENGRKATMIIHALSVVDLEGKEVYVDRMAGPRIFRGAGAAYSGGVVRRFPKLNVPKGVYEDHVFSTRALLLGECLVMDDILVKYRIGAGLTSGGGFRKSRVNAAGTALLVRKQQLDDIEFARSFASHDRCEAAREIVEFRYRHYSAEYDVCAGRFPWTRLSGLLRMTPENGWFHSMWGKWILYGSYVPPFGLGCIIRFVGRIGSMLHLGRMMRKLKGKN